MDQKPSVGIVILAAGSSSRLGQSKQLLVLEDRSLIYRISKVSLRSVCFPIQVVLGANNFRIMKKIEDLPVYIDQNPNWEKGMGNSLSFGLKKILSILPDLQAVIFLVCDQPYVTSNLINELVINYMQTDFQIVGSQYGDKVGVPALFDQALFPDLLSWDGDSGAGAIIKRHNPNKVKHISFEKGVIDIDTYEDYFIEVNKNQNH